MIERPAEPEGRLPERALALTIATLILLTPPIVTIFDAPLRIAGIPLLHVYCFAIWLIAIGLGAWLAKRLVANGALPDGAAAGTSDEA